jgi:NADH:ubiquinone oxidoreductase subunit 2 (subunit N)
MSRRQAWVTAAMAVLILIPSLYGFLGKFVHIYRGASGGEFAVAPILNYLLASAGFFCMLLWAAWNGMFRDVERPKIDFLENERLLDRDART